MNEKKPVKKKKTPEVKYEPPVFTNGMNEEQCIAHIRQVIDTHRANNKKQGWSESDLLIRNQLIIKWLGQGMPRMDVQRALMNIWGVVPSTAKLYVKEALEYLTQSSDEYRDNMREVQVHKIETLMEECRLMGKYLEASKFQDQLNKLNGLYVDNKKVEVSTDGPITVTFGE